MLNNLRICVITPYCEWRVIYALVEIFSKLSYRKFQTIEIKYKMAKKRAKMISILKYDDILALKHDAILQ